MPDAENVIAAVEPVRRGRNKLKGRKLDDRSASSADAAGIVMLVLRYFLYVGGALLALLLACAAVLPGQPTDDTVASAADTPQIRILSERKWPDRVVMDTNAPMPAPINVVKAEVPAPQPPAADVSAKARMREAYAKLPEQTASDVKKPEPKPVIRRRVARARVAPQPYYGYPQFGSPFGSRRVMAAQQPAQPPRFGFYW